MAEARVPDRDIDGDIPIIGDPYILLEQGVRHVDAEHGPVREPNGVGRLSITCRIEDLLPLAVEVGRLLGRMRGDPSTRGSIVSFALTKAGDTSDVRKAVADNEPIVQYGGKLGELTRQYLSDVLALQAAPTVIVEASGHHDDRQAQVSITIRPVF